MQVEIEMDRLPEFYQVIEVDTLESRKEPGCLRFDLLKNHSAENKFTFYEAYVSADALAYHKE